MAAAATEITIPRPHGWIGTVNDWMVGLGIAFAVLGLVLLVFAWRSLRSGVVTPTARGWLLVAVGLVPIMVLFFCFSYGLEASSTVQGCGACHTMTPFVRDLEDVKSTTLAATHFKNRYIQEDQCFTCHSDYGLGGTLAAKLRGLRHVWRYTTGSYTVPIKIADPFSNLRCLRCHGRIAEVPELGRTPERRDPGSRRQQDLVPGLSRSGAPRAETGDAAMTPQTPKRVSVLRIAVVLAALFEFFALVVLIGFTPILFTLFMFVGEVLFAVALLLLVGAVLADLRAKQLLPWGADH